MFIRLPQALRGRSAVTQLSLCQCGLSPRGVVALANSLEHNQTLACIRLDDNEVGLQGAMALAGLLTLETDAPARAGRRVAPLRVLSLAGCSLGDGGAGQWHALIGCYMWPTPQASGTL